MIDSIKKKVDSHKFTYIILSLILLLALFVRVYRTGDILGFYFDQGRDALAVWDLIHHGDLFLIGPTTGISGIFRGPFFYYLITPFYWLSGGDPVFPANFLALTSVLAIALMYYLGQKAHSRSAGIFSAIVAAFSFNILLSSRWLSNPTPMLLISMCLVYFLYLVEEGKKWAWVGVSFISGLALFHFGSSGELFYFPAILVILILNIRRLPGRKIIFYSIFAFFLTLAPLVLFDIRNNWLLTNNIISFVFEKDSFKSSFMDVIYDRLGFYEGVFFGKIYPSRDRLAKILLVFFSLSFLYFFPKLLKNKKIRVLIILLLSPVLGLLFFQGNEGNIYDYYLTGYYFIFILLFGIFLGEVWKNHFGKVVVAVFLFSFLSINIPIVKSKITDQVDGPTTIAFKNQKKAIEWIYSDADGDRFNVDVYVPPVIPYAYDYLFTWYPTTDKFNNINSELVEEQVPLLYTLFEQDPPHPERLDKWLERQKGIAEIEYEESFAGITVQRRTRK